MDTETLMRRAVTLIQKMERELRVLVAEAASTGDYESVVALTSWARSVAGLLATRPHHEGERASEAAGIASRRLLARTRAGKTAAEAKRPARGEYPKFLRRGDALVKVGWSRRAKTEYEHKVPWSVALAVAQAVAGAAAIGEVTTTERFLSAVQSGNGAEVPEYQVYVVLAWLRSLSFITKHGRQGYVVSRPSELLTQLEFSWKRLPVR